MARANPRHIVADMIDAQSFESLSSRFEVMGVPLTVVNGTEKLVGAVPEESLLQSMRKLTP